MKSIPILIMKNDLRCGEPCNISINNSDIFTGFIKSFDATMNNVTLAINGGEFISCSGPEYLYISLEYIENGLPKTGVKK